MPLIHWNPDFFTGHQEVDHQHEKLISILNELYQAMRGGKSADVLKITFSQLLDYTRYHFTAEEKLFTAVSYPEKERHLKEHAGLLKKAEELKDKFEKGLGSVSIELLDFLCDWITKHILGTDMTYKEVI